MFRDRIYANTIHITGTQVRVGIVGMSTALA